LSEQSIWLPIDYNKKLYYGLKIQHRIQQIIRRRQCYNTWFIRSL